jgi:acetyltransferase-like isoleucine patch superfamily enzyme
VYISPSAKIGNNVRIGDNNTIYDNVIIGDNSIICDNCVIGEPLNNYYSSIEGYDNPKTIIGNNALVRSYTLIYAGSNFGSNFSTGHYVSIRENCEVGNNCSIGTKVDIQGFVKFGNYCRLQSFVNVGQFTVLGDFVFIYPFVVLTNDPHPPSNILKGPSIDDFTQIASSSVILSDVYIGKHCLVGANSVVNSNVDDFSLVNGSPAKKICDLRKLPVFTNGKRHYPWPYNFERGMPWEGIGFDEWEKNKKIND